MFNVYKKRAEEAKKELKQSYRGKFASFAIVVVAAIVLSYIGAGAITHAIAGPVVNKASETTEEGSEQNRQRGEQIGNENNQEGKRELSREKVNDNNIKISSSEDGEAVDIVA